jgi:2-polyprenyl-3-methyl-5-hydroxy-6-metoxy-1,4-benzoquinol methylase
MNESAKIVQSWEANAANWILTVQNKELESRRVATNKAIVDAVLDYRPKKVLDLGCGEGWLSRTLRKNGLEVYGTDAIKALLEEAIAKDGEWYWQYSYEQIIAGEHSLPAPFDAIVINFALFDKELTEELIATLPSLLTDDGLLFIQTLHHLQLEDEEQQQSGWKEENWGGMKREYVMPYRWYYRTLFDWAALYRKSAFWTADLREILHPRTERHLSMIFILTKTIPKGRDERIWKNFPGNHFR